MRRIRKVVSFSLIICLIFPLLTGFSYEQSPEITSVETLMEVTYEMPDIIDKAELEENEYIGRVKAAEVDLYSLVLQNEDGTNTMRIYSHPVKYVDSSGKIKDISLAIMEKENGDFVTESHEIITTFEQQLTEGISLAYNGIEIKLIPEERYEGEFSQCIWGEDKDTESVLANLTMCTYCASVIEQNAAQYNHN